MSPAADPYTVLGVPRHASDTELRSAYRKLVRLHHPDHNNGSPESARRFEEVQEAYSAVISERRRAGAGPATSPDDIDARLADLERQTREAMAARERARAAARRAAASAPRVADARERPSDEELGYVRTDDSFTKILADALEDLGTRLKRMDERFER